MEIREAVSDEDREKIYRLRYDVYITEMDRGTSSVDHENRRLYDWLDDTCVLVGAFEGDRAIGSIRMNYSWKSDLRDYEDKYSMVLAGELHPKHTCILTKMVIAEDYRQSPVAAKMMLWTYVAGLTEGVVLGYLDCNAHLIPLYAKLGFVTYIDDFQSDEYGWVTPMMMSARNLDYLTKIQSPLRHALREFEEGHVEQYMKAYGKEADRKHKQWELDEGLHAKRGENYIFDGLSKEELARVFRSATVQEFAANDVILHAGDDSSELFVVLDGRAAVTREAGGEGVVVALFSRGQVFGEMGYLRGSPRSASVKAISDSRVLRFSSAVIDSLLTDEKAIAVKILRNLSIILANRLAKTTDDWVAAYN